MSDMYTDAVIAAMDLADRAGARDIELGFTNEEATTVEDAGWYISASYQGARIIVGDQRSPTTAAIAFAERMLRGATCRCTRTVAMSDEADGCRWRLVGKRWEPGCDEPPLSMPGATRGDYTAIATALGNRKQRRAAERAVRRSS